MTEDEGERRRRKRRRHRFLPSQSGGAVPMSPPENNPPVTEDPQPAKDGDEPAGTKTAGRLTKSEKRVIQGATGISALSLAARLAQIKRGKSEIVPAITGLALPVASLGVAYRHRHEKTAAYDAGVESGVRCSC